MYFAVAKISKKEKNSSPSRGAINPRVQPKLEIGQPNDKYEQQADAVADRVMMMPDSEEKQLQMKPILEAPDISMKCAECEEEESVQMKTEEEEESVQMKPEVQKSGEATTTAAPAFSSRLHSTVGQGHPLPDKVSDELGGKIGADFSNVKVHTDSRAIQMSKEIGAQAFTHGQDIYFNKGKYDPGSAKGKHLLAHELTHVVQQTNTVGRKIQRMSAADALVIAQNLNTMYPNWLNVLPDCPCTFNDAMANPSVWEDSTSLFTSTYHPGADKDVRTKNGYSTIPNSSHGQQCTYDKQGNLITTGPGAGTPDVWTPNTHFVRHQGTDVATYNALGSNIYVQYWQPNNGNNCEANVGGGSNITLTTAAESKIVAIRDYLYGWTSEGDIQNILTILNGVSSASEMSMIRTDISPILVEYLNDIGDRTRIRAALNRL